MRPFAYAAVSVLVAVTLAGCGVGPLGDDEPDVEVEGSWTYVSGSTADGDLSGPLTEMVTLDFGPEGAGGFGGCNAYGGQAEVNGSDLRIDEIASTLMACEGSRGVFEPAYLAALRGIGHVAREGDRLTLTGADVTLEFTLMPDWPEQAVVARTWHLHTILPIDTRPAGEPVTLYLGRNGKLAASTGCRSIAGRWMEWRGDVVITEAAYRGTCPEVLVEQSGRVEQTLSRFSAEINGNRELVLTSRSGDIDGVPIRLVYRR